MNIIKFSHAFIVIDTIQSCLWGKEDNGEFYISIAFNGSNGKQIFRTYFDTEKEAEEAFESIAKAVVEI